MHPILSPADATRLSQLDQQLRKEADSMLAGSGLGELLRAEGFAPVGSYVMKTMTWRDLDFERVDETPDWQRHWKLGSRLARNGWIWNLRCLNAYAMPQSDSGLYWGLRLSDPSGGPVWKTDLWTARAHEFAQGSPNRARWQELLTEEARLEILAIKEAVCTLPQYRSDMLSVHIYEAVLERGVRGVDGFMQWWRENKSSCCTTA